MAMNVAKRVVTAMERIAPLRLAEKWDNVGLLVESPVTRPNANQVLLTIDLTTSVCEEALASSTAAIVAYHPPLFRPLSSLTLANPIQASLLRCAAAGISIFSPHTSLDSAKNGVNDWLSGAFKNTKSVSPIEQKDNEDAGIGIGRLLVLQNAVPLKSMIPLIKEHLGLQYIQVAEATQKNVQTIAVCAGAGSSVLKDVEADLYWTGEMSHHEVLAAVAKGTNVILCGHSNTERGYLHHLKALLERSLTEDAAMQEQALTVNVSQNDKDPLVIM